MPNTAPTNQNLPTNESEIESRQRCYQCFRPKSLCFCEAIPQIDNRTDVLILQHVGERFHPFNTARIVQKALRRCQLIADHNQRLAAHDLPIHANAGLLYPRANAPSLTELPAAERPDQLVIIDGTWHQAKTIVRDVPQLHQLPCFRLEPASPGQYRIRREPNEQSLSTVEATVAALQVLEPNTVGLDQLLCAFHQMVENQLAHAGSHAAWRQNKKRQSRPRFLPHALLQNADHLVVAYGEATPGQPGKRTATPSPVNWVAQRLGTAERFSCRLRQQQPLSSAALEHMRLSAADFDDAVTQVEFHHQWNQFLRRNDVLIVYLQRTCQLLQHLGASQPPCLVLKSIFGKWRSGFHCVEELMAIEGVTLPKCEGKSRADQRLAVAVALVEHLRTRRS
ncbi:MAG: DTW domain-containing protein [Planctomycetota bacterium]|nr:DTW domain-containing protein [Planctomycetota bacterium]